MNFFMKRVAIIGFYHESNTFVPDPTTLAHFERNLMFEGEVIREKYGAGHHEITGFFEVLDGAGIEVVPLLFAHAIPWGRVTDEALDTIWNRIKRGLEGKGPFDGILAAPHGAGVNESRHDMDGWWLTQLRATVGPSVPIVATMDPHVNLSPEMVKACNALISYRENPHLDQRQRGIEAATLMVRTLRGEISPVAAGAFPPIAINIERQLTSAEPILSVQRELDKTRALHGILSASLCLGFPYADVPEMGSAIVVVADGDQDLAEREAARLGNWLLDNRELFRGQLISPEDALKMAEGSAKPVGLLDMGDNSGGGAPGDSTVLARLCQESGKFRTLCCLPDPESVKLAQEAGIGARVKLKVGGKLPMTPAPPLEIEGTVVSFYDGKYTETQPRHGGKTGGDIGPSVVINADRGLTLLLASRRGGSTASVQPLYAAGLNPKDFDVIIIKGVHAPVGAYVHECPTLIRVNTPGVTTADMESLTFHHRRKPLFPFEDPVGGK